jgi:hypothetical protein
MAEKPRHMARYRPGAANSAPDGRMFSPTFERNSAPICGVLTTLLAGKTGRALEVGSGVGQHVCAFAEALPAIVWTPSDPDAIHRASIAAWIDHTGAPAAPPLALDASSDWSAAEHLAPLQAVFSANVIHISPWAVAEGIVAGAGRLLAPDGVLAFYGPFRERGRHTAEGNASFDVGLRADNAAWGVRDLDAVATLAEAAGLGAAEVHRLPANNIIASFRRLP